MKAERMKQAVSGQELVDYYGTWKTGFDIVQAGDERLSFSPDRIKDLFNRSARHNPLLYDLPAENSKAENYFTAWAKAELGRALSDDEARRLHAVFRGEGMPPEEFFPDGRLSEIWPPKISLQEAMEECIGRDCGYQEKMVFLLVRLIAMSMNDDSFWLDLEILPGPFGNHSKGLAAGRLLRVGGRSKDMDVRQGGLFLGGYVSWSLITGKHVVNYLTEFAATKPTHRALLGEFRKIRFG